jgi:hypothetical protein
VNGTVRVRVNGNDLVEGVDEDFTVDYDIGAVTFNPRVLISQDDFVRIEYEYKAFDYRRTFAGGGASYYTRDSVFSIRGILWSESDDKNNPIEMQLSSREREILRNSGNNPAYAASTARPVHPLDVARMSVFHPLYKKVYDAAALDTILVYTPYDPLHPENTRGFYTASFTPIQTGTVGADYVIDTTVWRGQFVYRYAGAGQGNFTALAPITAPMRESAGELLMRLELPRVNASLNVVGKESDRNLFSSIDDGTDRSSAVIFNFGVGERRMDRRTVWVDFDYRYRSRKFRDEIFSADERRENWGSADGADGVSGTNIVDGSLGRQFQSWESTVGGTIAKGAAFSVGAGQAFVDSVAETEKVTAGAQLEFIPEILGLSAGGAVFRHRLSDIDLCHRRYGRLTARPSPAWETALDYRDEWRVDTSGYGGGHLSGTAEAAYIPANLRQSFSVVQYRRGENFPGSIDTGYALTWNKSTAFSPLDKWRVSGDSRWRRTRIDGQGVSSTFLMSAVSEIEPTRAGFSSRQEYRVNQELASRFEQKMFFVGRGLGTHAFDSTVGGFRPNVHGDHIIQEVKIYDNTVSTTVRKTTLSGDWYFRPTGRVGGILNDLTWSGVLSLEEHVDSRNGAVVSYIPGLQSLFPSGGGGAQDPPLSPYPSYSDLMYRQSIEHQIQGSPYRSRLYFLPGMRIIRGYRESTFETALLAERKKGGLLLSAEPRLFSVRREDLPGVHGAHGGRQSHLNMSDAGAELVQSLWHGERFEFYLRERAGRIFDNGPDRAGIAVPPDSSFYLQIRPGVIHRPAAGRGMAELSYTFSYVPWGGGELDFRMAGGLRPGTSHIIAFLSDVNAGRYFLLSGLYRGELTRRLGEERFAPMTHVFSLRVKAFL